MSHRVTPEPLGIYRTYDHWGPGWAVRCAVCHHHFDGLWEHYDFARLAYLGHLDWHKRKAAPIDEEWDTELAHPEPSSTRKNGTASPGGPGTVPTAGKSPSNPKSAAVK